MFKQLLLLLKNSIPNGLDSTSVTNILNLRNMFRCFKKGSCWRCSVVIVTECDGVKEGSMSPDPYRLAGMLSFVFKASAGRGKSGGTGCFVIIQRGLSGMPANLNYFVMWLASFF